MHASTGSTSERGRVVSRGGRPSKATGAIVEAQMSELVRRRDRQSAVGEAIRDLDVARREQERAAKHVREAEIRLCAVCQEDETAIRVLRRANAIICEHGAA